MKLANLRSAVTNKMTGYRPTDDLSQSYALIDYFIFGAAGQAMEEYQRSRRDPYAKVQPWMVTELECQVPALTTPLCAAKDCMVNYYLDLPFELALLADRAAVFSVEISESRLPFYYLAKSRWSYIKHEQTKPSRDNMAYSIQDNRIYFLAGNRDLSKAHVSIKAVAGGPRKELLDTSLWSSDLTSEELAKYGFRYTDNVNVGVPINSRARVVDLAVVSMLNYLGLEDLKEDGNQKPKPSANANGQQ